MQNDAMVDHPEVDLGMRFCVCHCNSPMFGCTSEQGVPILFRPGHTIRGERRIVGDKTQVYGFVWLREKWRSLIITVKHGTHEGTALIC